jgi:1-acyl-sn-glycerol-3-phosphate acyltransferase
MISCGFASKIVPMAGTDPVGVASSIDEPVEHPDALQTAVAAVRSVATFVAIAVYVLIAAPPGLLLAQLFKWPGVLYVLGHGGVGLALKLAGIKTVVRGREHLTPNRAVVFCANHQSNVDPPVLFQVLHRRLHVLYKAELSKLPLLGRVFILGEFVPVERANREAAMASVSRGAESLRAGNSFLIFPEGTRSRTRQLLPFKKGGFIMALQAGAPVVPVAIDGGRAAMHKGSKLVWPTTVTVTIGPPIETSGMSLDDRDTLIATVRDRVQEMLDGNAA